MTEEKEYSPSDAAEEVLGWKGRYRGKRLIRKVLAKEKKLGREIFKRTQSPNGRMAYSITKSALTKEFHELLKPTVDSVLHGVLERLDELEKKLNKIILVEVNRHMSSCIKQNSLLRVDLKHATDGLESRISTLNAKIASLESKRQ